ncbi:MAG: 4-hydroxythreonine-4-phosphate dehydrogenase PdxA [Candidatus Competibacterales bacterium]
MTAKPIVALTLGDPAGIGPELTAKLLARDDIRAMAHIVLAGDRWLWEDGQDIAGVAVDTREIQRLEGLDFADHTPLFLPLNTVSPGEVTRGVANAAGGRSVLAVLDDVVAAAGGQVDAVCFAPLNKHAMKQGGLAFDDELHHFAHRLAVQDYVCELNVLDNLWTSRITSHVALKEVAPLIDQGRIVEAAKLVYRTLVQAGVAEPRVAVAGLNPHAGDGGNFGREEIDIIAPAVAQLQGLGFPVTGPWPADTVFLKAKDGELDAVVTMYHDQGQIAMKLLGFDRGVTVQGGLPVPITTPAHGTAYDISGQNRASVNATVNAFRIACRMGLARRRARSQGESL